MCYRVTILTNEWNDVPFDFDKTNTQEPERTSTAMTELLFSVNL